MLGVKERSPSSTNKTGNVSAYRKVKSQSSFVHNVFFASVESLRPSPVARFKVVLRKKFKSVKRPFQGLLRSIWINTGGFEPCRARGFCITESLCSLGRRASKSEAMPTNSAGLRNPVLCRKNDFLGAY